MRALHALPCTPLACFAPTTLNRAQGDSGAYGADDRLGRPAGKKRPECGEADSNHADAEFNHAPKK